MILPIVAYGHPVLKKKCKEITNEYENLEKLIDNMWQTMYNADGIGLAAPQVGKAIRLFLVDTQQFQDEDKKDQGIKKVLINAQMIEESGAIKPYEEGCLSIPGITGDVERHETIKIKYLDEKFEEHTETFTGMSARVIQHEYDHIEGRLFTELLKPLKKKLVKRKLDKVAKGNIDLKYRMKFQN